MSTHACESCGSYRYDEGCAPPSATKCHRAGCSARIADEPEPPEPDYNAPSAHERHVAAWEEKRRLS